MFDRLEVKFAWNRLGGSYSGLGGGFAIGTDVYLFYKKLQELARQSEIERQKVLEEKKKQTKKWFEEYFQYIPCKEIEGKKVLEITKKDFQKLLDNKEDFSEHCFRLFDSDDSGDVSIPEIQAGLNKLSMTGEAHKKTIKWFVNRLEKYTNGATLLGRVSANPSIQPS